MCTYTAAIKLCSRIISVKKNYLNGRTLWLNHVNNRVILVILDFIILLKTSIITLKKGLCQRDLVRLFGTKVCLSTL